MGGMLLNPSTRSWRKVVRRLTVPSQATPVVGLRRRRTRDVPACVRLLRVVFYQDHYPTAWPDRPRAWLEDDVLDAWVVEDKGEILGHIALTRVGLDALSAMRWREDTGLEPSVLAGVSRLFVRPRVRGRGVGPALLDAAVSEARARGLTPVLEVLDEHEAVLGYVDDHGWRLLAMHPLENGADRRRVHHYAAPPATG